MASCVWIRATLNKCVDGNLACVARTANKKQTRDLHTRPCCENQCQHSRRARVKDSRQRERGAAASFLDPFAVLFFLKRRRNCISVWVDEARTTRVKEYSFGFIRKAGLRWRESHESQASRESHAKTVPEKYPPATRFSFSITRVQFSDGLISQRKTPPRAVKRISFVENVHNLGAYKCSEVADRSIGSSCPQNKSSAVRIRPSSERNQHWLQHTHTKRSPTHSIILDGLPDAHGDTSISTRCIPSSMHARFQSYEEVQRTCLSWYRSL